MTTEIDVLNAQIANNQKMVEAEASKNDAFLSASALRVARWNKSITDYQAQIVVLQTPPET